MWCDTHLVVVEVVDDYDGVVVTDCGGDDDDDTIRQRLIR